MKNEKLASLMQKHNEYNQRLKEKGVTLLSYKVPCCDGELESRQPEQGDVWDTLATCPHCGSLYLKISTKDKITALIPSP